MSGLSLVTMAAYHVESFHVISSLDLGLRLVLSVVFLVSATGKLWDLSGTRQALSDFGVSDNMTAWGARALPAMEALIGIGLLFDPSYRLSASVAAVLSLGFTFALANLLRQGRRPPCHCFGAVQSSPVGYTTLVRALVLFVTSAACSVLPGTDWTTDFRGRLLAFAVVLLAVSGSSNVVLWKRLKSGGRGLGLRVGQRVPAFRLLDGSWMNTRLRGGKNLLVVTSSSCSACDEVKTSLARWRAALAGQVAVIELEATDEKVAAEQEHEEKLFCSFKDIGRLVVGTPGAMLLDERGFLLANPVAGIEQIEALLRVILSEAHLFDGD